MSQFIMNVIFAVLGLVELALRFVAIILIICTLLGIFVIIEYNDDHDDLMTPALWKMIKT